MVITGHFIDYKWRLHKRVLNFVHVPPPRTGLDIADGIYNCLKDWGIEDKIFSISVDNASYNDRVVETLKRNFTLLRKLPCKDYEPKFQHLPSEEDWDNVTSMCTNVISGSYYPTANLYLIEVYKVKQVLDNGTNSEDQFVRDMVKVMKVKFDKYWGECHLLMAITSVLDPRLKNG
ncbi:zinc finger BED domain-containing protein RICESLEEPER 1-like isoform X2 [Rutidosis leptorrhynchoides]|uniref:zinc finger BED domain-containing protein RICESLEEPER 1-like isoform X2 n=1 Tax=Rutidosis leptorrhynchoides TaxID=125765 RepID=UPI003A9A3AE9